MRTSNGGKRVLGAVLGLSAGLALCSTAGDARATGMQGHIYMAQCGAEMTGALGEGGTASLP